MSARWIEIALWTVALGGATNSAIAWRRAPSEEHGTPALAVPAILSSGSTPPESLSIAAARIAESDPFRLERRPSSVAFQPGVESGPMTVPQVFRPPKPPLALKGVLGGPPWEGLLAGVPGRDGDVVVRKGDKLGELTVKSVGRDTVVVQGMDTTWRLTVKRVWQ